MTQQEIEEIELQLLLESIYQLYGYDFRQYARASLMRRVKLVAGNTGCKNISDLIPRVIHDQSNFLYLLHHLSITVTEMFRDPKVFLKLTETVFPLLGTHPYIKIWHAGCATGEEAYSLAILLKEAGIYDRCTIFATDFNDSALEVAKAGVYRIENMKQCLTSYRNAGGINSFSEYYTADSDSIVLNKELKKNITFANHNLVLDRVFGEMHMILCRNVLIYFNKVLQNKTLELFKESLVPGGFLCIGTKESISFSTVVEDFTAISEKEKIFRKKYGAR